MNRLRTAVRFAAIVWVLSFVSPQPVAAQSAEPETENPRSDRTFNLRPRAYVQLDWRGYPDWDVSPGTGRLEYNRFEARRFRAGIDGSWRAVAFEVTVDPQDSDGTFFKDTYAQLRMSRTFRLHAGQFKVPGGREYQTSARNLDFIERSALASSLGAGRDIGVMLSGEIGADVDYQAGLFAGDGNGRAARSGLTSAGRVIWSPGNGLQLGGSLGVGRTSSKDEDPANGLEGRTASGYRFFERVYVQGRRDRLGADARWDKGPWRVTVEMLRVRDERAEQGVEFEDLPAVVARGWSLAVRREFGRRTGQARVRAREWDLGLRLDGLVFDDEGPQTGNDSVRPRAGDVRRKSAQTLTGSISWRPLRWARIITDVALEQYKEARSAPEAGRRGPYWTAGTRLQVEWPW